MTHQGSSDTAPLQASDDFVTVMIGDQSFGIPVETIQDVFQPQAITHVPLAPKLIDGVLNLRGRIVTAIDVRKRLGMEPRDRNKGCMAIGIEKDQESFGLLVDKVGEVLRVSRTKIDPNPPNLDTRWRDVSKGICQLDDRLLIILDVDKVLDFERSAKAA